MFRMVVMGPPSHSSEAVGPSKSMPFAAQAARTCVLEFASSVSLHLFKSAIRSLIDTAVHFSRFDSSTERASSSAALGVAGIVPFGGSSQRLLRSEGVCGIGSWDGLVMAALQEKIEFEIFYYVSRGWRNCGRSANDCANRKRIRQAF